jgi:beta-lactamase regulating signal transducer with metallopeptidase domain
MSPLASSLPVDLLRTTLLLAGIGLAAALLLRIARVRSPTLHRAAWCVTLLVGWTFLRLGVSVPWYAAEVVESAPLVAISPETPPHTPLQALPLDDFAPPTPSFVADESLSPLQIPVSEPQTVTPSVATPIEITVSSMPWKRLLVLGWAIGMASIVAWWLLAYLRFAIQLPRSLPCRPEWQAEWEKIQREQGSTPVIVLRVTTSLGPLLCRLPRGAELLVPAGLWQALSREERAAILRHELAHHQRRDVWKSLAMRVLALPHWFNPIAWLAVRRFDEAAEWACDRAAMGTEPTAYARMLLHLGELASAPMPMGTAMSNLPLTNRIRRLLTLEMKEDSAMKKAALVSLLLLVVPVASLQVSLVAKQPKTKLETPKATQPEPEPAKADLPAKPTVEPVAKPMTVRAAELKMVEAAKKAFEATLSAYLSGTTTLDPLVAWSTRWLAAELVLAKTRDDQVAAARANLERLQSIHRGIAALYTSGSRGGESQQMETINYYVADAERRLAEIESKALPAVSLFDSPAQPRTSAAGSPQSRTQSEPAKPLTDQQQNLRYDGKTFDEWADEFDSELSPVKRKQAMEAMGEFAAHGFGPQAAEVIFRVMRDYSVWTTGENNPEGKLKDAAIEAAMRIPAEERLPQFLAALSAGNKNQRLFALRVVPLEVDPQQIVTPLISMLQQPDWQIVELTWLPLTLIAHDASEVIASIQRGLRASDVTTVRNALWAVRGSPFTGPGRVGTISRPYPDLLPDAIAVLDSADNQLRQTAKQVLTSSVVGPAQLEYQEALETAAGAGGSQAEHVRDLLDSLNGRDQLLSP